MTARFRRRTVLTGLALAAAAPFAFADDAQPWAAYDQRLTDALTRAGPGNDAAASKALLDAHINPYRRSAGLMDVAWDNELGRAALVHAADMAVRKFYDHPSPEGFSHHDRVAIACRSLAGAFAENIHRLPGRPNARRLFDDWKKSPAHNANMLMAGATHVGCAVIFSGGTTFAVLVIGVVEVRMARPVPFRCTGAALHDAVRTSDPAVTTYDVTDPRTPAGGRFVDIGSEPPMLAPGAWRLRPLKPGPGGYQVLAGPVFIAE